MQYLVSISNVQAAGQPGGTVNLNQQVEAANVLEALDKAKAQLTATLAAAGLATSG